MPNLNTDTAKRFLSTIRKNTATIRNLTDNRDELVRMLYALGADPSKERVQTTPDPDKFGSIYGDIDQMTRKIDGRLTALLEFKARVTEMVNALENEKHSRVLYLRYISLMSWDAISAETGYSTKYLFRLHAEALEDFQRLHGKYMEDYFRGVDGMETDSGHNAD